MPSAILRSDLLNTTLILAHVTVTDIVTKSGEPLKPHLVQVRLRFEWLPGLADTPNPIQFDPIDCAVLCDVDFHSIRLAFRRGHYTGFMPRGRFHLDRRPNYYLFRLRAGTRDFTIASVPVVHHMDIIAPSMDSSHFIDVEVPTTLASPDWSSLWNNDDPRFQFQHTETVTLTEYTDEGTERIVGQNSVSGSHLESTSFSTMPAPPFATPGHRGTIYGVTQYRATDYTVGPSDFHSDWTSSAGSAPVPIVWQG